jgi:SAM-dependent methyltransferase
LTRTLRPSIPVPDVTLPFGSHGSSNWVWLARIARLERAADVGGTAAHALGLAGHFESVLRVVPPATRPEEVPANPGGVEGSVRAVSGTPGALPLDDASVDCVALRIMLGTAAAADPAEVLREGRRVIRPGGCMSFGFDNRRWLSRARARRERVVSGLSPSRVRALATAAGFRELDLYYADPAFAAPTGLIEPTGPAAHAFEVEKPMRSALGIARPLLARAGLHAVLYPAYLAIAYR